MRAKSVVLKYFRLKAEKRPPGKTKHSNVKTQLGGLRKIG